MGVLVYILGKSGTGKSHSMRNFPTDALALINVQGKVLPFKGGTSFARVESDDSVKIIEAMRTYARRYKTIVIDDFQYVMANEFMRRSIERGYDKFTEIGRHAWDVVDAVRTLPHDCIVYVLCHIECDDDGGEKIKTIGKLLDEKICLEGMSTIVLKTNVTDGKYSFVTQNSGKDTVKSPAGMFPSMAIDNDLYYVDSKIRSYYGFDGAKTDAEMATADESVKREVPEASSGRRRRQTTPATDAKPSSAVAEPVAPPTPISDDYLPSCVESEQEKQGTEMPKNVKDEEVKAGVRKRSRRHAPAQATETSDIDDDLPF